MVDGGGDLLVVPSSETTVSPNYSSWTYELLSRSNWHNMVDRLRRNNISIAHQYQNQLMNHN